MNNLKLLQSVHEEVNKINTESLQSIMRMCNEDEDINMLVWYILTPFEERSDDKDIQAWLIRFIYNLGYEVGRNEYHNVSIIYNLDYFLGNYFFDDAEAAFIESDNWFKEWKCINAGDYDVVAKPIDFIEKAKENVKRGNEALSERKKSKIS